MKRISPLLPGFNSITERIEDASIVPFCLRNESKCRVFVSESLAGLESGYSRIPGSGSSFLATRNVSRRFRRLSAILIFLTPSGVCRFLHFEHCFQEGS